jgi:4-amino-4-deoxy-L-arabinose transferase-like glycosyltransferase
MSSDGTTLFVLGSNGLLKVSLETAALAPTQENGAAWLLGQVPGLPIGILIGFGLSLLIGPSWLQKFGRLRLAAKPSLSAELPGRATTAGVLGIRRRVVPEATSSSNGFRVAFPTAVAVPAPRRSQVAAHNVRWWANREHLALGALLLVMLVTRLVSLGTLPDTLNPDEADNIQSALRILHGAPPENGFFGFDWYGEPAFTAYFFALFIKLFGVSEFAARLPTALISVVTLGFFYQLLRRQLSVPASLVATLLLGSQLWYVHLSRMAWNNLHAAFFTLAAMLAVLFALDNIEARRFRRARAWIGVCGVVCALTLYGYPAGRVALPSLFAVLPLALVRHRSNWKLILGGSFVIGAIAVLLFVPEALYIQAHWDGFNMRVVAVSILNKPEFQAEPLRVLGSQIVANFLGFWVGSFNNMPSHFPPGEPLLDPVTGLLVLGGMIASLVLRRFRSRFETWLWWSVFLVGWFFTEVITEHTPDGARGIGWMPALLFFAAVSVELVVRWDPRALLASIGDSRLQAYQQTAVIVVSIGALVVASADFAHYVRWSNLPETRRARDPYIAKWEFAAWSAAIIQQADQHQGGFPVGEWRARHPLDPNGQPLEAARDPSDTQTENARSVSTSNG